MYFSNLWLLPPIIVGTLWGGIKLLNHDQSSDDPMLACRTAQEKVEHYLQHSNHLFGQSDSKAAKLVLHFNRLKSCPETDHLKLATPNDTLLEQVQDLNF